MTVVHYLHGQVLSVFIIWTSHINTCINFNFVSWRQGKIAVMRTSVINMMALNKARPQMAYFLRTLDKQVKVLDGKNW